MQSVNLRCISEAVDILQLVVSDLNCVKSCDILEAVEVLQFVLCNDNSVHIFDILEAIEVLQLVSTDIEHINIC